MCYCNRCSNPCQSCTCSYNYDCGCATKLDFECIIYHKANSSISELDGLNLSNGSTLELIIESIDEKIKQLNVIDFTLSCLRQRYVINTMQQFAQAVDTELCLIKSSFYLGNIDGTLSDSTPGQYWFRTDLGELHINLDNSIYKITITAV